MYDVKRTKQVASLIPKSSSTKLALDIGCNTGIMAEAIESSGYTYIGLDISKDAISTCHDCNLYRHLMLADATSPPFRSCFSLITALEIIEHLDNPEIFLDRLANLLVDNGYLLISTPNRLSLEGAKGKLEKYVVKKEWNAWNDAHKHIFTSCEFLSYFQKRFKVETLVGYYFLPHIFSEHIDRKWWFGSHVRFSSSTRFPLNRFGFQVMLLLKKK
ncbi:MAG: class I SAM-dependent methyltransferase [Candidatus Bathyarchaeota archaeon]|nr:class I SAM-dependent methyltransferase [Candidatus Bathyarchaeota archaeon]